jgi:hypothetical protein
VNHILYKYVGVGGLDILEALRLKISSPVGFNDPFEFAPLFKKPTVSVVQQTNKMNLPPDVLERFSNLFVSNWGEEEIRWLRATLSKFVDENFGVICLSDKNDDLLMWAHYGDRHSGLCIGFDFSQFAIPIEIHPINYSDDRPELDTDSCPLWSLFVCPTQGVSPNRCFRFQNIRGQRSRSQYQSLSLECRITVAEHQLQSLSLTHKVEALKPCSVQCQCIVIY